MSDPFIAEIKIFAGNFAPRGWAFCNGQLLPIAQNTALFSLIGTTYGGDGRTTCGLPNLQGRAPMHPGRGPGLTARRLGERAGAEQVTLTENQLGSHTHPLRALDDDPNSDSPALGVPASTGDPAFAEPSGLVAMAPDTLAASTGGNQPHANVQPFLVLNFIIALVGLYPSRS
jgi:microcystin-dependent protein